LLRNEDRANEIKVSVLTELIEKMRDKEWLTLTGTEDSATTLASSLLPAIRRTQFMNLSEFGRTVHAEMAALIDAARRGVAVNGLTMYVTTFPCHNCAKHVIAAGIRRVVYLEPYPKSRANLLHREEIDLESVDGKEQEGKVVFSAFSGIAPRQYRQLFSMSERGAQTMKDWDRDRGSLSPLYVTTNASLAYAAAERQELEKLQSECYVWDKNAVCPQVAT
jgi:cytidine deaminase